MPILSTSPIADARMALHRHLASINGWPDTGGLRGLVFVAIDGVAGWQQQLGLAGTDELLEDVSLFLIDHLADTDRCFRFAVGEYVLSVERGTPATVSATARALVRAIGDTEFGDQQRSVHVTASASAIMLGAKATANDRWLQQLVDTGYGLRKAGGDAFCECEGDPLADTGTGDDIWKARLEQALATDGFCLAFQTVTSLAGDQGRYYDVLLRYVDDHDDLIMPAVFLPAAEQAGLMPDIDHWVARHAARVIADQAARNVELALFVKLAPSFARQLAEQNSENAQLQRVVDFARQHRVPLIAEHIGDATSMARLWQAGVNYVQGHFIQEPDPAALQHGETIG